LLAAQEPWWSPGTSAGYHAITQGYLIGEIVRRVTGISLGRFFASEIAEPICADFHIGLSPEDDDRVAPLIPPPVARNLLDPESLLYRVLSNPRTVMAEQTREDAWRRAEIPAANGFGNARSLAAVQSIIACGGDGPRGRLISTGGCNAVFEEQADGLDRVLDRPIRWGNGYALNGRRAARAKCPDVLLDGRRWFNCYGRPGCSNVCCVRDEPDGWTPPYRPTCTSTGGCSICFSGSDGMNALPLRRRDGLSKLSISAEVRDDSAPQVRAVDWKFATGVFRVRYARGSRFLRQEMISSDYMGRNPI
jgi:hypothetical protein